MSSDDNKYQTCIVLDSRETFRPGDLVIEVGPQSPFENAVPTVRLWIMGQERNNPTGIAVSESYRNTDWMGRYAVDVMTHGHIDTMFALVDEAGQVVGVGENG